MDNNDRANRARKALACYRGSDRPSPEHLGDLLGDLMHMAVVDGLDFKAELERGSRVFSEELSDERTAPCAVCGADNVGPPDRGHLVCARCLDGVVKLHAFELDAMSRLSDDEDCEGPGWHVDETDGVDTIVKTDAADVYVDDDAALMHVLIQLRRK